MNRSSALEAPLDVEVREDSRIKGSRSRRGGYAQEAFVVTGVLYPDDTRQEESQDYGESTGEQDYLHASELDRPPALLERTDDTCAADETRL